MTCGSCVANVKSLLEKHPTVKSASVNLTTGTALVHVRVPDKAIGGGKSTQKLLQKMGEDLAEVPSLFCLGVAVVTSACARASCLRPEPMSACQSVPTSRQQVFGCSSTACSG